MERCLTNYLRKPGTFQQDKTQAPFLKSHEEILQTRHTILHRRRRVEHDDTRPITDPDTLAGMWNRWAEGWFAVELNEKQKKNKSIFNSWTDPNCGGKFFVTAIWQTGLTWVPSRLPSQEFRRDDPKAADDYIATEFVSWALRLICAVHDHKKKQETEEARNCSGEAYGKRGDRFTLGSPVPSFPSRPSS